MLDEILVAQSLAGQYGLPPTLQDRLRYRDWSALVAGLRPDSPLGLAVAARMERDSRAVARMSPWQRRQRSRWASRKAAVQDPAGARQQLETLQEALRRMYGRKKQERRRDEDGTDQ